MSYQRNSPFLDAKLPLYNGKEDWKVWLNRFEAVAKRRNWDDDTKLDNLLPKLQGRAGDFVFTQLSEETISCYSQLIKELNSRFWVVETQKTFAVNFIQTKKRNNPGNYQDKKFKRYARRANYEDEIEDVETEYADDDRSEEEALHIMRLPSKDEQQKRKTQKGEHRKENHQSQSDSLVEVNEMLKSLAGKVEELQKDSKPREEMKQNMPVVGKSGILCYAYK